MYAYIKGTLEIKTATYVVIETGGIGYKIFMSKPAIDKLGEIGNEIKVYTHYHVREDEISLYGFTTNEELRMFELLISVSGIGSKSAITMLSNISPSEFAICVISNDVKKLVKVPGIGSKTAARIILELQDKLKTEDAIGENASEEVSSKIQYNENVSEAISALQVLGYARKEIENAFEKIDKTSLSVEDLIRKGLTMLSK